MKKPRIININTTAYESEDFLLLTNLTVTEIVKVITPIVNLERRGYEEYDNEGLVSVLKSKYPSKVVDMYIADTIDTIRI